jgi:CRP/FNR family transcriptional regulator, cyclic AMP receptor protein
MVSIESFLKNSPVKSVKKDDNILLQNTVPEKAFAIKSGIVKIYNLTSDGEEKSILFNVDGEIFPICWLFSKTETTVYYYQAYTDCELYVIDKDEFIQKVLAKPELAHLLLEEQAKWHVASMLHINALEQSRASVKLLSMFHFLSLRYGETIKPHRVRIRVPFTQHELANFTGLTRETTAIELKRMREAGIVSCRQKFYYVNTNKLNDQIDDDYNPGIHIA